MIFDLKNSSFIFILILSLSIHGWSQTKYSNQIEIVDGKSISLLPSNELFVIEEDSLAFVDLLQNDIINLWSKGFLLANLDTVAIVDSSFFAKVYIGASYMFGEVEIMDEHLAIVHASGLKNVKWKDKTLSIAMISQYAEALITYLENNGFPFANVHLDSTSILDGKINSRLVLSKNIDLCLLIVQLLLGRWIFEMATWPDILT